MRARLMGATSDLSVTPFRDPDSASSRPDAENIAAWTAAAGSGVGWSATMEPARLARTAIDGEVLVVSVLFADLRGFTAVAERLPPRCTAGFLNDYLSAMAQVIQARHGMVQDFVGDGIVAVFGAPSREPDHAWHAATCAVEMRAVFGRIERPSPDDALAGLTMGVSIHSGEVFAGVLGAPQQRKYAAVGDTVNTASRLEELNRALKTTIVMSGETAALLKDRVEVRNRGRFRVRGRTRTTEVFEFLALRGE